MVFAARLEGVESAGELPRPSSITALPPVAAGIPAPGLGSAQSSSCPGVPPAPPPRPAGLLCPALSAPRVRPARGPASFGSPHPGAWLHEAEDRAREVPSAPAAPGPGEKVQEEGMESKGRTFISETK